MVARFKRICKNYISSTQLFSPCRTKCKLALYLVCTKRNFTCVWYILGVHSIYDYSSALVGSSHRGLVLALDEIHRLDDPALLLKIAADHFPETRIIATGSSTLCASSKFRDTLAGRKAELYLTPLCEADSNFPHSGDRTRRLLHGGLPALFFIGYPR